MAPRSGQPLGHFLRVISPVAALLALPRPHIQPCGLRWARFALGARRGGACYRRDWQGRSLLSLGRGRSFGRRRPSAPSDARRHAQPPRRLSIFSHWRSSCVAASSGRSACCDGCAIGSRIWSASSRSFSIDRRYPPKPRSPCSPCPARRPGARRHKPPRRSPSICGSSRDDGRSRHGSCSRRREWRDRPAARHRLSAWPW